MHAYLRTAVRPGPICFSGESAGAGASRAPESGKGTGLWGVVWHGTCTTGRWAQMQPGRGQRAPGSVHARPAWLGEPSISPSCLTADLQCNVLHPGSLYCFRAFQSPCLRGGQKVGEATGRLALKPPLQDPLTRNGSRSGNCAHTHWLHSLCLTTLLAPTIIKLRSFMICLQLYLPGADLLIVGVCPESAASRHRLVSRNYTTVLRSMPVNSVKSASIHWILQGCTLLQDSLQRTALFSSLK